MLILVLVSVSVRVKLSRTGEYSLGFGCGLGFVITAEGAGWCFVVSVWKGSTSKLSNSNYERRT